MNKTSLPIKIKKCRNYILSDILAEIEVYDEFEIKKLF